MILVTGATGFLGKNVCLKLEEKNIPFKRTSLSMGLDLREPTQLISYIQNNRIKSILNCAAFVGGIKFGYDFPTEMFNNNLLMTINLLQASKVCKVNRIVNPISNCAYPAKATLFKEEEFWDGPLHESVLVYGFVRKASWIGSWAYNKQFGMDTINLIFSNMYGPGDHFDEERSHALGALIKKIVNAKKENLPNVTVWGSGKPVREWLHVQDASEAMIRALYVDSINEPLNVGVGKGISIIEMAEMIKSYSGKKGELILDNTKPDGAPFKTVDGNKGEKHLNWSPQISFKKGLKKTVQDYLHSKD